VVLCGASKCWTAKRPCLGASRAKEDAGGEGLVFYCRIISASTAPCTSRRMCCSTDCASHCAPCQPLLRAFSGWFRSPPPTRRRGRCRGRPRDRAPRSGRRAPLRHSRHTWTSCVSKASLRRTGVRSTHPKKATQSCVARTVACPTCGGYQPGKRLKALRRVSFHTKISTRTILVDHIQSRVCNLYLAL